MVNNIPSTSAHETAEPQESYYMRNAEARRQYQINYNRVQRVTRRKLSKSDLAALRERKRNEVNKQTPSFHNRMCQKSQRCDPERTEEMAQDERDVEKELERVKKEVSEEYSQANPHGAPGDWIPTYVAKLQPRIEMQASWGRACADRYLTHPSSSLKMQVHAYRRKVALLHQDVDLLSQGLHVPMLAMSYKERVVDGYCVNKREFRRVYGF